MGDALSVQIIKWFHLNARGSSLEIFKDQQGSSDLRKLSGFIFFFGQQKQVKDDPILISWPTMIFVTVIVC